MSTFPTYYLSFRSPLHIGERGVGLEGTRTHVPADTLFGAICSVWRLLYGVDSLKEDLLLRFNGETGKEPFFLTSAFPYAHLTCACPYTSNVRLFPKPLAPFPNVKIGEEDDKVFRRIRYVSEGIFNAMLKGESLEFSREHCICGSAVWVTDKEKNQLSWLIDYTTGDTVLWKKAVVPRVTLDRLNSSSTIWHFGKLILLGGCGLWFAAWFNPEYKDLRQRFEAALHLLGDEGLGGERGAGHGLFELKKIEEQAIFDNKDAKHFVTLSPVYTEDKNQARLLTGDGSAYDLSPRRGWVTSPEAANLRRKVVWMFTEGSVLTKTTKGYPGGLADVKPDVCEHDVWRYGYAFAAGVRG